MILLRYTLFLGITMALQAGCRAQTVKSLLFREDWKEIEAALPLTKEHVANPNLILSVYGPGRVAIKKSNHPHIPNDPFYIWSGECRENWALGLRHKSQLADLSGDATISFRSRQSGFRQLRVMVKLHQGEWLVSDQSAAYSEDWSETEFKVADLRWRKLNINDITEGAWVEKPDVRKVEEIGFTDLMRGAGTPASSRLDWIAVYGKPVVINP
jgi:hypothetical protein